MFNQGINELLQSLPQLEGMNVEAIRRLLTRAWLEAESQQHLGGTRRDTAAAVEELRRLATALEAHLILAPGLDTATARASAFVAAEALDIATEHRAPAPVPTLFGDHTIYERIETGLLYLIAGYDANAAVVARAISETGLNIQAATAAEARLLQVIRAYLTLRVDAIPPASANERQSPQLHERVREAIMDRLGAAVAAHLSWLAFSSATPDASLEGIAVVISLLETPAAMGTAAEQHPDLHHLAILLHKAIEETTARALRNVSPPPDGNGRFQAFQTSQAKTRPLLWPAAADYAQQMLPGPRGHAVVTVPTGAGKSAVAELAIAQALNEGWVLYLAPTNALAGQIRRQLDATFVGEFGADVREITGGLEYSGVEAASLETIGIRGEILVMTPEKCTLALRQNPDAFADLRLCVVDEAHLLGNRDTRALVIELALGEILLRSPAVRMLLLSALIANPGDIAAWLTSATSAESVVVNDPWRPTRTLRAVAAFESNLVDERIEQARNQLSAMPSHLKNVPVTLPVSLVGGLQGAWSSHDPQDILLVRTTMAPQFDYHRKTRLTKKGHINRTAGALAQHLADQRHHVLVFLPFNRQHCFTVAEDIPGPHPANGIGQLTSGTRAQLELAEAEIGGTSVVRGLLEKGVAVHTAAMLPEERRASELAYEHRTATIMFATGTMAQGLNLPATAVVIGGTKVAGGTDQDSPAQLQRRRAELLNAIGRAGRATVASRSMAIVIPDKFTTITANFRASDIRPKFLDAEDASTEVESHLRGLLQRALDGNLDVRALPADEQTALTILSFKSDTEPTGAVLRRTWAATDPGLAPLIDQAADILNNAATDYLRQRQVPAWVAAAAHRSGTGLPVAAAFYQHIQDAFRDSRAPETVAGWSDLLLTVLADIDLDLLQLALPPKPFTTTKLENIHASDPASRSTAWQAMHDTVHAWMSGAPLMTIAEHSELKAPNGNLGRTGSAPLPRTWNLVDAAFRHWMAMAAGSLGAIITEGSEAEPGGRWDLDSKCLRALALLPLGVRFGAGKPSTIAWMRAGARPRTVAHLLDELVPAPDAFDDEELQRWAWQKLESIRRGEQQLGRTEDEQRLIAALAET